MTTDSYSGYPKAQLGACRIFLSVGEFIFGISYINSNSFRPVPSTVLLDHVSQELGIPRTHAFPHTIDTQAMVVHPITHLRFKTDYAPPFDYHALVRY